MVFVAVDDVLIRAQLDWNALASRNRSERNGILQASVLSSANRLSGCDFTDSTITSTKFQRLDIRTLPSMSDLPPRFILTKTFAL